MVDGSPGMSPTGAAEPDGELLGRIVTTATVNGVGTVLETPWLDERHDGSASRLPPRGPLDADPALTTTLLDVRARHSVHGCPVVVAGAVGPRHPCASEPESTVSSVADSYRRRICELAREGVDFISGRRVRTAIAAIGIARAASTARRRSAHSFDVDDRGHLSDGSGVVDVLEALDRSGLEPLYATIDGPHVSALVPSVARTASLRGVSGAWLPLSGNIGTHRDHDLRLLGLQGRGSLDEHETIARHLGKSPGAATC